MVCSFLEPTDTFPKKECYFLDGVAYFNIFFIQVPITCKDGGDVVSRDNKLRDVFVECCRRANVSAQVEVGSGFGHDKCNTRPADVLVANWSFGKRAAFDLTVTSPLNPSILSEAGVTAGSATLVAECRKHDSNGPKCSELGWKCTPLAVETYGCWAAEARETLSRLPTHLAISMRCTKSKATASIYGRLSLTLVRSCARAGPSLYQYFIF